MSLKTDYKDYELAPNMGGKKRYRMINNDDGTVSFVDVSEYLEIGDTFSAGDINATNNAINEGSLPSNAVVFKDESTPSTPAPRDADTLGGHTVDYFATSDRVNQKDIGSFVDISSYTNTNQYICPNDGYVQVINNSGASGLVSINGTVTIGGNVGRFSTFVRKGMKVFMYSTCTYARYYPII